MANKIPNLGHLFSMSAATLSNSPAAPTISAPINQASALPEWHAPVYTRQNLSGSPVRLSAIVSALSHSLDLSTGQPIGHAVRSCILGMRIAEELRLSAKTRTDLYYALLLKDCGCSGNASKTFHALGSDDLKAKRDVKTTDWTRTSWETIRYALDHVAPGKSFLERSKAIFALAVNQKKHARDVTKIRCERGSTLARLMGLSEVTAAGILNLDEHWDGSGNPEQLRKYEIPVLSRLMLLAQTLEYYQALHGAEAAIEIAVERSRKWFDPDLVKAAQSLHLRSRLWTDVASDKAFELVLEMDPERKIITDTDAMLDSICVAFANIVDAKSPFTFNHSNGVANATVAIARTLDMNNEEIVFLRHAALLHDLGKLSVSNAILEKPAKLDDAEWQVMRLHPFYTWKVLSGIPGFDRLSEIAASHHEKLNGKGYFRGMTAEHLPVEARILAVADIFDALAADRPYRAGMPLEKVFGILRSDAPHALDPACIDALEQSGITSDQNFIDLHILKDRLNSF